MTLARAIALALVVPMGTLLAVGCQNTKKNVPVSESVTDVSTGTSSPTASATPAPSYTPAQTYSTPGYSAAPTPGGSPVYSTSYDTGTGVSAGGPAGPIGAGTYTVRRGDTLYGIAKARYGDGKQWQKIVNANPGLAPGQLKVGQTINLP